jgi:alanyl-tRNA synthetase
VFEGDAKDGVPQDSESFAIWKKYIAEDRIILASKKDNFWEMGDTGPCGPCTEIHVDLRSKIERDLVDGKTLVNYDHPQVIEIWNNVFMQFNRKADGSLEPLPATHVDTGMGLERLAMALQGKTSNYDTDLFQTLIQHMEKVSGVKYGVKEETDIALRVISDHVRAIAFSIADGQLPSNTGAGYVIRRILRRAVRYGYQTLGMKEPFLCDLSLVLSEIMGDPFVELINQRELVQKVIREEEISFFRTLEKGLKRIDGIIQTTKKEKSDTIDGVAIFELFDTYGFPVDLTSLIARENDLSIDEEAFNAELQKQKDRSRDENAVETDDWMQVLPDENVEFIGYDNLTAELQLVKYRKVSQKQKSFFQLVFNQTPFYPEGGGQVGDKGTIEANGETIHIFDTKKENNLIIHLSEKVPTDVKATFLATVNEKNRIASASNHSATHLLHHALRTVLGTHVEQKGSLVNPEYLRFDFSHFSKVSDEELAEVERIVTEGIHQNISLDERRNTPIEEAKALGAMALFGEKYGDSVRVIKFGESVELCGGTHVPSTSKIGLFKITTETAVAAGVRRIEAITSEVAENFFKQKADTLETIALTLKNPKDLIKAVEDLLTKNNQLTKDIEVLQREKAMNVKGELKSKIETINGINFLGTSVNLDGGSIKDILFQLKGEVDNFFGVIGGNEGDKCTISIIVSDAVMADKGLNAGNLVREVAKHIQGGGGGQAFFATAGGKNPSGLKAAIEECKAKI